MKILVDIQTIESNNHALIVKSQNFVKHSLSNIYLNLYLNPA